jgi:DNA-binding response OmpR family regulator
MATEQKPHILIVEDDLRLQRIYQTKLTQQGWDVATAADGEEGSRVALTQYPDVILLDLMLPKKDGFAVLADLQKDPKGKKIIVLILSNLGQQADIDRGKGLGAKEYMVKANYSLDSVVAKINAYLPK